MKLIELLVKELPKQGGWPESADYACQDSDGEICFYSETPYLLSGGEVWNSKRSVEAAIRLEITTDRSTAIITREQYEAALVESVNPESVAWDGNGLPPVGCECEVLNKSRGNWYKIKILWSDGSRRVCWEEVDNEGNVDSTSSGDLLQFRPLRTPVERQRENAINEMASMIGRGTFYQDAEGIYSAIAAGKIPGVTLTQGGE